MEHFVELKDSAIEKKGFSSRVISFFLALNKNKNQ